MKTLYIVRHAKSSWEDFNQSDFERPLNDRGHENAPEMAKRLLSKKIKINAFISSPALRARQTCEHFCKVFSVDKKNIIFKEELYHAPSTTIANVIERTDDDFNTIAVFTHNPGISEFVNSLDEDVYIDNMPTCGVFAVQSEVNTWEEFADSKKTFLFFDYPKNI
jgi:phosphohistidine phosphatase